MRSYDEYCAIAKSLDVVGDRWTLTRLGLADDADATLTGAPKPVLGLLLGLLSLLTPEPTASTVKATSPCWTGFTRATPKCAGRTSSWRC